MITKVKRGDIFLADLSAYQGSEQKGVRPVLIIQNNKGNKYSPTTIVACLSSKIESKKRLLKKISKLSKLDMKHINRKISISLELKDKNY